MRSEASQILGSRNKETSEARLHKFKGHLMMPSEAKLKFFLKAIIYLQHKHVL